MKPNQQDNSVEARLLRIEKTIKVLQEMVSDLQMWREFTSLTREPVKNPDKIKG